LTSADKEVVEQFIARLRRQIAAEALASAASEQLCWPHRYRPSGGDTAPGECAGLLWHDFASFAPRSFRELNPRTRFAMHSHSSLSRQSWPPCARAGSAGWSSACRRAIWSRTWPRQAVPELETTAQGSRVATSVGGVLTGLVGQPDKASSGFSRSSMTM